MTTMKLSTARACIETCIAQTIPTFLWGAPGIGKTELHAQIAKSNNMRFLVSHVAQLGEVDARGLPIFDQKTGLTRWLPPSEFPRVFKKGEKILWLLDEFNLGTTATLNCFQQLVLDRRLGEYVLPDSCVMCAAGNRQKDGVNVTKMSTAMESRFVQFTTEPDVMDWIDNYGVFNTDPVIVGWARFRPELMHKMPVRGETGPFPNFRSWQRVSNLLPSLTNVTRQHVVSGNVGDAAGLEFEGFYRTYRELPDIEDILRSPDTAKVPGATEPGACYAISAAMGRLMTKENITPFLQYATRLPKEYEILVAVDAIKREPALQKTKAFGTWAARNSDVTL
jgi:hypothetical protein